MVSYIREAVVFGLLTYLSTAISHHPFSPAVIGWPVCFLPQSRINWGGVFSRSFGSAISATPHPFMDVQRPFSPGAPWNAIKDDSLVRTLGCFVCGELSETLEFGASPLSYKPAAAIAFHSKLIFGTSQSSLPRELENGPSYTVCEEPILFFFPFLFCFYFLIFSLLGIPTFVLCFSTDHIT